MLPTTLIAFIRKWLGKVICRMPFFGYTPLRFPTSGFAIIDDEWLLEEEGLEEFEKGFYCPVMLGEILDSRYQTVGKLGFGTTSTVWLARDLWKRRHVALKVYARDHSHDAEFKLYQTISEANIEHPGRAHVRSALDIFKIRRNFGEYQCLVQKPMWGNFSDLLLLNPARRFTPELLKGALKQIFLALDYLHTECRLIHTDIKADNIMVEIGDDDVLDGFVKSEMAYPCPRKISDKHPVYASRSFAIGKGLGPAVLSDFGTAVNGDKIWNCNAQPDFFRSPEVMLQVDWSYPIDIWNVGVVIWELFEDDLLFVGEDPEFQEYRTRAHLAEIIAVLGPPPQDLLQRGRRVSEFFDAEGNFIADVPIPETSLEERETSFEVGSEKQAFLAMVRSMLQWRPEDRKTARELLDDPWLNS